MENKMNEDALLARKRKILMKKFRAARLNKSIDTGNNSFNDMRCYYEAKLRKLRNNNKELAKGLAEQREMCQNWYDEVVTTKAYLQEKEEKLLSFRLNDIGNFEEAVEIEAEKKISKITRPLNDLVQVSINNVVSLVENLTNVKTLIASMTKCRPDGTKSLKKQNGLLAVGRRSMKSPRKNVVHPMVGGHVIQPTTINLPRISLEDQRKYRLQVRMERTDDDPPDLSVINEQSLITSDLVEDEEEIEPVTTSLQSSLPEEMITEELMPELESDAEYQAMSPSSPSSVLRQSCLSLEPLFEEPLGIPSEIEPEPISLNNETSAIAAESPKEMTQNPLLDESLSASNEVFAKPESVEPIRPKRACASKNAKKSVENEDPLEGPSWFHPKKGRSCKRKKNINSLKSMNTVRLVLEKFSDDEDDESEVVESPVKISSDQKPKLLVSPICTGKEFSRVSRRQKSKKKSDPDNSLLVLNDSLQITNLRKSLDNLKYKGNKSLTKKSPIDEEAKENIFVPNETCLFDASMEMTECMPRNVIQSILSLQEKDSGKDTQNYDLNVSKREEKENLPPSPVFSVGMRNVSIVIEDIMKMSPPSTFRDLVKEEKRNSKAIISPAKKSQCRKSKIPSSENNLPLREDNLSKIPAAKARSRKPTKVKVDGLLFSPRNSPKIPVVDLDSCEVANCIDNSDSEKEFEGFDNDTPVSKKRRLSIEICYSGKKLSSPTKASINPQDQSEMVDPLSVDYLPPAFPEPEDFQEVDPLAFDNDDVISLDVAENPVMVEESESAAPDPLESETAAPDPLESETAATDPLESSPPLVERRRRRAVVKLVSLKEPSLMKKMRSTETKKKQAVKKRV